MSNPSGTSRGNLSGPLEPAESATAQLVARAGVMMIISALTTVLAIAAVVTVIGYRMYAANAPEVEDIVTLPKGARIVSMAGSSGRVAVLVDNNGTTEMLVFDLKTMKQSGRLRFATEP
jgi:hypothetical protein